MAADIERLGEIFTEIKHTDIVEIFNALMARSHDDDDRARVIAQFEEAAPALHEFVHDIDDAAGAGFFEDLTDDTPDPESDGVGDDFHPIAYGMLLGFLTLSEMSKDAKFKSMFQ